MFNSKTFRANPNSTSRRILEERGMLSTKSDRRFQVATAAIGFVLLVSITHLKAPVAIVIPSEQPTISCGETVSDEEPPEPIREPLEAATLSMHWLGATERTSVVAQLSNRVEAVAESETDELTQTRDDVEEFCQEDFTVRFANFTEESVAVVTEEPEPVLAEESELVTEQPARRVELVTEPLLVGSLADRLALTTNSNLSQRIGLSKEEFRILYTSVTAHTHIYADYWETWWYEIQRFEHGREDLAIVITAIESYWCTVTIRPNNFGGIKHSSGWQEYASIEEGISAVVRLVYGAYLSPEGSLYTPDSNLGFVTLESMVTRYCPENQSHWLHLAITRHERMIEQVRNSPRSI